VRDGYYIAGDKGHDALGYFIGEYEKAIAEKDKARSKFLYKMMEKVFHYEYGWEKYKEKKKEIFWGKVKGGAKRIFFFWILPITGLLVGGRYLFRRFKGRGGIHIGMLLLAMALFVPAAFGSSAATEAIKFTSEAQLHQHFDAKGILHSGSESGLAKASFEGPDGKPVEYDTGIDMPLTDQIDALSDRDLPAGVAAQVDGEDYTQDSYGDLLDPSGRPLNISANKATFEGETYYYDGVEFVDSLGEELDSRLTFSTDTEEELVADDGVEVDEVEEDVKEEKPAIPIPTPLDTEDLTGPTPTTVPTATPTRTPTKTATPTSTSTPSPTKTSTLTPSPAPVSTDTPTNTPTPVPTDTPTRTPTPTFTATSTATQTPTSTSTQTPTQTPTPLDIKNLTGPTASPTNTTSPTPMQTLSETHLKIMVTEHLAGNLPMEKVPERFRVQLQEALDAISTPTKTPTQTPTETPTSTNTATKTPTRTPTRTPQS